MKTGSCARAPCFYFVFIRFHFLLDWDSLSLVKTDSLQIDFKFKPVWDRNISLGSLLPAAKPNIARAMGELGLWRVDALINVSATFAGVAASFWVERRRSTNREKDDFGKILHSLLSETASNHAHLENVKACTVSAIPGFSLRTQVVLLALGIPLFHRWAKHSLVMAASIVADHIELVNNMLNMCRVAGSQLSAANIEELRTTALKAVGSFPSKDGSRAI